jgi:hypothetical protein
MDAQVDTESQYENHKPTPELLIEYLMQSENHFQRREQLEALEKLTKESIVLQQSILRYRRHWEFGINLLQKAYEGLLKMQNVLEQCLKEEMDIKKSWFINEMAHTLLPTPSNLFYQTALTWLDEITGNAMSWI